MQPKSTLTPRANVAARRASETIDRALVEDPYSELDLTMAALFRRDGNAFLPATSAGFATAPMVGLNRDDDIVRFLITWSVRVSILMIWAIGWSADDGRIWRSDHRHPDLRWGRSRRFTLYGVHRDGTRLDPDEIAVLGALAESAGQAYLRVENSRLLALVGSAIQPSAS